MPVTVKIEGLDDILAKMKGLSERAIDNAARRSLRKGANVIKTAAVNKAKALDDPKTPERIDKNITVQGGGRDRERQEGGPMMRVGVLGGARKQSLGKSGEKSRKRRRRLGIASLDELGEIAGAGAGNPGGDTFFWRFLEFGTSKMRAKPFMRPAMTEQSGAAFEAVAADLPGQLDKELAKLK